MESRLSSESEGPPSPNQSGWDGRLRLAARAANVGFWDWDLESKKVYYSPEWKRQVGHEEGEIGDNFSEWERRLHPEDAEAAVQGVRDYLQGLTAEYRTEFRIRHKDGSYRCVLAQGSTMKDEQGRPVRFLGAHVDITEYREALRDSEELHRVILGNMTDTVMITDDHGGFVYVCPNVSAIFGYSEEEVLGLGRIERLFGGALFDRAELEAKGELPNIDWQISTKQGRPRVLLVNAKRVSIRGGTVLYTCRDVTARRRAEVRIHQLNRVYAVLSDINGTIVREGENERLFSEACRIAVEKGGFRMAWVGFVDRETGAIRMAAHEGATPDTLDVLKAMFEDPALGCAFTAEARRSGAPAVCNNIALDPLAAGWREEALRRGYRSMAALPLKMNGEVTGMFNLYAGEAEFFDEQELRLLEELALDIGFALQASWRESERRRAAEALRESEERFRQLAETIQDVFWMIVPESDEVLYVSPAFERIWGRSCRSLYESPKEWLAGIHAEDRERVMQRIHARRATGEYDEEYRVVRPDGEIRWIRDMAFPVRNAAGKIERLAGVARDITERRRLEEQLRQSQKMEAIGQLAGGVAHDFNNILTVITLHAELAGMDESLPEGAREALREVRTAAARAASLTRQLLMFSRRQILQPGDLDLNETVTGLAKMLQRIIGEDVRLQLHLSPGPLMIRADAGMLDQVILNLAVNARDAMPEGGRLLIETEDKEVDLEFARLHPDAAPGRYAWLGVSDTGVGIRPEILPRIFEPFFTTKEPGKGTGLGLATVYGIVKQHRGWIQVFSQPGEGSSFQVFLPLGPAGQIAGVRSAPKAEVRGGTETILLVEDEMPVRTITRVLLERNGYRVLEAANGVEALKIWDENRESIALLLTDLVMPGGLSGQQLASRLQQEKRGIKVVFASGYSAEFAGRRLELRAGENYVEKPFSPDRLLETIRFCLDG